MLITYFGGEVDFIGAQFFTSAASEIDVLSVSSTQAVLQQSDTGATMTVNGTGFTFVSPSDTDPTGGTISDISFSRDGSVVATITGLSWNLDAYDNAVQAAEQGNLAPLNAFWNADPITFDASNATNSVLMDGQDVTFTTPLTVTGTSFNDLLIGGTKNDRLTPGESQGYDVVRGTAGNDKIVYSDSLINYQKLDYSGLSKRINITIDGATNTGTVKKGTLGTDKLIDIANPLESGWTTGGFGLHGTAFKDIFTLNGGEETWMQVSGGAGKDTFNLTLDGFIRLDYLWDGADGPTQGVNINIAKGKAFNDGFGNRDLINITDGDGRLQIRGTNFDDKIIGSSRDEDFISEMGRNVINGGGGVDTIRYDHGGVNNVRVDLAAKSASVVYFDLVYRDTLIKIENVRGSREGNDTIKGNGAANKLEGRGGNDKLFGKGGSDELYGEEGNDVLKGGKGFDWLVGGTGNDRLFGNGGPDNFVFDISINEGKDTVFGFKDGVDQIAVEGADFSNVSSIAAFGSGGKHTKIILDSGTEILLKNTDSSLITEDDFNFF